MQQAGADGHIEGGLILAAGGIAADPGQVRLLAGDAVGHLDVVVQIGAVVHIVREGHAAGAALLPGAGVLVHVRHDLFHQLVHLPLVGRVGGGGKVVQRVALGHLLVALVHDDLIEGRQLRVAAGLQLKAVDLLAVGQLFHHLVQLPELSPCVEDIVLHAEQDILAEAVLAVPLGLLQTGGVAFQIDAHKALVLGAVLVQPRKAQRIIAHIVLVVGLLGRFQRAGQIDGQRIVQLGLRLFRSLCGGAGLIRRGQRQHPGAGQRLHQRMRRKEAPGSIGALLGRLPCLFLLRFAGGDLLFAHADVAARLLHGGAGSLPRGFAGFFLLVKLLQQRVLAALGELCFLLGHSILCSGQGGTGVPQSSQLLQRRAPQQGLVLVIGGFQVLFCLGGSTGAFPQSFQLGRQRTGAGAAGVQTDVPLGGAQPFQPEGMVAQKVAGSAVRMLFQRIGGVAADDAAQNGLGILCSQRVFAAHLRGKAVRAVLVGAAVGLADARGVQQADRPDFVLQGHKGALGGFVVSGRHKDVKAAVPKAGLHAVLPALVLHVQQLAEDLCVRLHAPALQFGVDRVPHPGGGIVVGVDPLAAGHGVQLRTLAGLFPVQGGGVLAGGKIGFFQRFFLRGEPRRQLRKLLGGERFGPDAGRKAAAAQHCQQALGAGKGALCLFGFACSGVQRRFAAGKLLGQGVQCPALAAGAGGTVGRKIGPAGFRFGIFGVRIAGVQLFQLAASCIQMLLPDRLFATVGSGAGQQRRAPVHKGLGLLFGSFAAKVHDLFQRVGAGLGLGQHGVQIFQLQPVTLQRVQIQLRLGQDVLVQKLPEVGDLVHAGAHLEHLVELFAQRAGRPPDAQRPADAVPRFAGAAGVGKTACFRLEVLLGAGCAGARVDERQLFQRDAVLGEVPGLVAGVQLLHGAFGLHPHRNDKGGALDAVPELRPDIGHGMARAAVGVLAALLGVDRALQGASALFIAQCIEIAVGGQAVADGVQNGGLAHSVDTDHIGQAGAVKGDVFKVVPVDEFQPLEFDHSSPSPASSARSYKPSSVRVRPLSAAASARSASGRASSTVGNTSMRLSSPVRRPTGRARLYRRRVRIRFSSVFWSRRRGKFIFCSSVCTSSTVTSTSSALTARLSRFCRYKRRSTKSRMLSYFSSRA